MIFTVWEEGRWSIGRTEVPHMQVVLHLSFWSLRREQVHQRYTIFWPQHHHFLCGKNVKKPGYEGQISFPEGEFPKESARHAVAHCEECVRVYGELRSLGMLTDLTEQDIGFILNERINNGTPATTA